MLWPMGQKDCHKYIKENSLWDFIREERNQCQFGSDGIKPFSFLQLSDRK